MIHQDYHAGIEGPRIVLRKLPTRHKEIEGLGKAFFAEYLAQNISASHPKLIRVGSWRPDLCKRLLFHRVLPDFLVLWVYAAARRRIQSFGYTHISSYNETVFDIVGEGGWSFPLETSAIFA